MINLKQLWKSVLKFFGIDTTKADDTFTPSPNEFSYFRKDGINHVYVASKKIANMTVFDSQVNVASEAYPQRAEFLNERALRLWRDKGLIASRAVGDGKVCVFPYFDGQGMKNDYVMQNRIFVLETDGEHVTDMVVLSEVKRVKRNDYAQLKCYKLENGVHTITQIYANLTTQTVLGMTPPAGTGWQELEPFSIANVDRLLFGAFDCPIDPRNDDVFYRVGLSDGCKDLLSDLKKQWEYLVNEYDVKKPFVGLSNNLFTRDKNGKLAMPEERIFKLLDVDREDLFEIFDPAIRSDPIFQRFEFTFEQLENMMSLSKGILSKIDNTSAYNNTSNIKRGMLDTISFVGDMRANIERGMKDYLYACNVLAEHFGLTPQGASFDDMDITFSWSNVLTEDTDREYEQYKAAVDMGAMDVVELRQWLTGEDIDTATARVQEISQQRQAEQAMNLNSIINQNIGVGG